MMMMIQKRMTIHDMVRVTVVYCYRVIHLLNQQYGYDHVLTNRIITKPTDATYDSSNGCHVNT
jgi:branched-subunit amino acid transport protein AzlD